MMNALELVDDYRENWDCLSEYDLHGWIEKAIPVLHQQQAEIEALKAKVDELAGYKESYENCHRACGGYGMN